MLTLTGKCLGTKSETVQGPNGSFVSTEIAVQTGDGFDLHVDKIRVGRDFAPADLPKDGENVVLRVFVSAYATRNGAGYRLTAESRVHGSRIAAAS